MVHSGPFVRGIHLTLHAQAAAGTELPEAGTLFREAFAGRPFVRVLSQPPELTHVVGTNEAQLFAVTSPDRREIQVMLVIDNLVKGSAGQALQNFNLMHGLPETTALEQLPLFP